jgi:hypothetical protein
MRLSTLICWRRTKISASRRALDWNCPMSAPQSNLSNWTIVQQHHPIRTGSPAVWSFRHGQRVFSQSSHVYLQEGPVALDSSLPGHHNFCRMRETASDHYLSLDRPHPGHTHCHAKNIVLIRPFAKRSCRRRKWEPHPGCGCCSLLIVPDSRLAYKSLFASMSARAASLAPTSARRRCP